MPDIEASNFLNKCADILDKPNSWTYGAYARNKAGNQCYVTDKEAVCWCAKGAIMKVTSEDSERGLYFRVIKYIRIATNLDNVQPSQTLSSWNDSWDRTQSQVVDAFRRAAELASRAGN